MRPRDIHEAVDQLIQRQRIRLFKDDKGYNHRGDVPSLIEQLQAAVGRSGNGSAGGRFASRAPISLGVITLLTEITTVCAGALKESTDVPADLPGQLRRIAADRADRPPNDSDTLLWIDRFNTWTAKARNALGIEARYPRGLRGIPCPQCGSKTIPTTDDDGKPAHAPALQFDWTQTAETPIDELPEDRKVRAVVCQSCEATWWPGAQFYDLQEQIEKMIKVNLTQETLSQ